MKFLIMLLLGLGLANTAMANVVETYKGLVETGRNDLKLECAVTVTPSPDGMATIEVLSPRIGQPLEWQAFEMNGDSYQRNDDINGFIKIGVDKAGSLTSVYIQYETQPNPSNPFNLSTVSEFCDRLVKQP
jgi:hypothetical protein